MFAELMMMTTLGLGDGAPQELGAVEWGRDLNTGLENSKSSGKPVLLLFQEIPGCATCRNFGDGPLSNSLVVDAIENEFHPVAIYNNRGGEDARVLKLFQEPSWNNPVMRFVDSAGADLIPRRDGVYSDHSVLERLEASLIAAKREVPEYVSLAVLDASSAKTETVAFAMHCYWQGEAKLGGLDGVTRARCGWHDGKEVVELDYRPDQISLTALTKKALEMDCASNVYVPSIAGRKELAALENVSVKPLDGAVRAAKASDQRYHLSHSILRFVPMTETQSLRLNSALAAHKGAGSLLSPSQLRVAARLKELHEADASSLDDFEEHARLNHLNKMLKALELSPR